jgi:hypothetical protein
MKPVKFGKVTKKYIKGKILKLNMDKNSNENLFNTTMDILRSKRLFLKDMKAITYFAGKYHLEIGFYTKDTYFSRDFEISRGDKN